MGQTNKKYDPNSIRKIYQAKILKPTLDAISFRSIRVIQSSSGYKHL